MVHFDDGVPDDVQSKALFDFEVALRKATGLDIRVLKDRMQDDSPLRIVMDKRRAK
jgi:hypothetical protein